MAVPGEIESPEEVLSIVLPRFANRRPKVLVDVKQLQQSVGSFRLILGNDLFHDLETHVVEDPGGLKHLLLRLGADL